jgi:PAS domain S-box-containing protein
MASKSQKPPEKSIPARLIKIFAGLTVGILAIGYFTYWNDEQRILSQAERQITSIAELKTQELVQWREERLADSAVFSRNPAFIALFRRYLQQPGDVVTRQHLLGWLASFMNQYHYNQVRLMNRQGETILSVPGQLRPAPKSERQLFAELIRKNELYLSDFYRSSNDQRIYLAVRVPILDPEDGDTPLGLLSLRIDPEKFLYPFILKWPTPSESAETLLVRRDGDNVLYLNNLRFSNNSALNLRIPLTRTEVPAVQAVLGRTGIVAGRDYRNVPVIADVRSVPDSPWFLITRMDTTEVYAPAREKLWLIFGLILALLAAAGASLAMVWRQQHAIYYRERYRVAEELRKANELFSLFMHYSPVYIFIKEVTAVESRVLQASDNYEQMVGIPAAQMRGKTMAELFPAELAAKITADDWAVVSSGSMLTVDEALNGRHYTSIKFPIVQDDKVLLAGYTVDITERKQAEEMTRALARELEQRALELAAANQELEAFSYTLSHDLRSYLTRISLASESLSEFEGKHLGHDGTYCLQTILDSCQSMDELIATMLTLARITRLEMQYDEIDLSGMAGKICAELALAEPDRAIHFAIAPGLHIIGDSHLLHVALENLFGNACKYTRENAETRIALTAEEQAGRKVYAIADNGIGFDMSEAGKLFQPFQRLDNARTFSGFGIGLTTVQRIIQRHGGEIWAEATPGKGATFYFTLPSQTA